MHSCSCPCLLQIFFEDTLRFFTSLYGHKLPVMAMDISADNSLIVTASADKNVRRRKAARRPCRCRNSRRANH